MVRARNWLGLILASFALSGCLYPKDLHLDSGSAHPGIWPILFGTVEVNGSHMVSGGNVLTAMPPPVSKDMIVIALSWVEYHSGQSWLAQVEVPLDISARWQSTADLEILVGRNGAVDILSVQPGQSDPVATYSACATRTPDADAGFRDTIAYFASLESWDAPGDIIGPLPPTPCPLDGVE